MAIQDIFNKENHIYKITKDIDLEEAVLNIPYASTLDFSCGGKIKNGTIILNNTYLSGIIGDVSNYITAEITGTYGKGQCLFDNTLGKPKWWNGTAWVDATGTEV